MTKTKNVYKILFIISITLFILLLAGVGVIYYIYERKQSLMNNDFDLTRLAKNCTTGDDKGYSCLCSISNNKQKICIKHDGSSIRIPSLSKEYPLPSSLPTTENDPFMISILNQKIGIFQNPFYPSSRVICLKNNDNTPRRLCFDDQKQAFIFGPTDFSKTSITMD